MNMKTPNTQIQFSIENNICSASNTSKKRLEIFRNSQNLSWDKFRNCAKTYKTENQTAQAPKGIPSLRPEKNYRNPKLNIEV